MLIRLLASSHVPIPSFPISIAPSWFTCHHICRIVATAALCLAQPPPVCGSALADCANDPSWISMSGIRVDRVILVSQADILVNRTTTRLLLPPSSVRLTRMRVGKLQLGYGRESHLGLPFARIPSIEGWRPESSGTGMNISQYRALAAHECQPLGLTFLGKEECTSVN